MLSCSLSLVKSSRGVVMSLNPSKFRYRKRCNNSEKSYFRHFGGHFTTPVLSTGLASRDFFVSPDVLHKSTDFCLPTTNFTTLGAIDTWRLAAILPGLFWGWANNKNDQSISPGHTCLPNLAEIRACLGTQNALMNFLHFGGHFPRPFWVQVLPLETFLVALMSSTCLPNLVCLRQINYCGTP